MIPVVHGLQVWNLKSFYDDVQAKQPSGCYRSPAEWRVSTVCHCYCSLCLRGNLAPPSSRVILPLRLFTLLHLDPLLDQESDHPVWPATCQVPMSQCPMSQWDNLTRHFILQMILAAVIVWSLAVAKRMVIEDRRYISANYQNNQDVMTRTSRC